MPEAPAAPVETPTLRQAMVFGGKSLVLKIGRMAKDAGGAARRHELGDALREAAILGRSVTPIWANAHPAEMDLNAGKVQNLRVACRELDGVIVDAGAVFSFWKQVGRATRRRGFVEGRELREGCLVPTIGGGLCQLSNALYDAALRAGMEIVERHAHSKVIPGSLAEQGRDATVFWNYVDLRFRSESAFRVEARLTKDELIVELKGEGSGREVVPAEMPKTLDVVRNCFTCEQSGCFRNDHRVAEDVRFGKTAFVVDARWPEFDRYVSDSRNEGDVLLLPWDGRRHGKANYGWATEGFADVGEARCAVLRRSLALRRLPKQGRALQTALIQHDVLLARALARQIEFDVKHVVVSQNLLPYLWRDGVLGGRTFDVLMTRYPMEELHRRLTVAKERHPESATLGDFRADPNLVEIESEALRRAERIVTPHAGIADLFCDSTVVELDWALPEVTATTDAREPLVLFAASPLARKGYFEFREAIRDLDVSVMAAGGANEIDAPWEGVEMVRFSEDWPSQASLVVLPAYIEHQPRRVLRALSSGVPALATVACGIREREGLTVLPEPDAGAIRAVLSAVVAG